MGGQGASPLPFGSREMKARRGWTWLPPIRAGLAGPAASGGSRRWFPGLPDQAGWKSGRLRGGGFDIFLHIVYGDGLARQKKGRPGRARPALWGWMGFRRRLVLKEWTPGQHVVQARPGAPQFASECLHRRPPRAHYLPGPQSVRTRPSIQKWPRSNLPGIPDFAIYQHAQQERQQRPRGFPHVAARSQNRLRFHGWHYRRRDKALRLPEGKKPPVDGAR